VQSNNRPLESYGLQDSKVLEAAIELAPALFAALAISNSLQESSYPLTSDAEIEQALREVATAEDRYESPGVSISARDSREMFPNEFLPVTDRLDLLRKVYMAIVIAHETAARSQVEAAKRGELQVESSHPLNVGDL
jgi:hypothetical protein